MNETQPIIGMTVDNVAFETNRNPHIGWRSRAMFCVSTVAIYMPEHAGCQEWQIRCRNLDSGIFDCV